MNLWYYFMYNKKYPDWFWSKSKKEKSVLTDKDFKLLMDKLNIKDIDVEYLVDKHYDFIKEELKYYKSLMGNLRPKGVFFETAHFFKLLGVIFIPPLKEHSCAKVLNENTYAQI